MREMKGFITIAAEEIELEEDQLMTLPKGAKSKVLAIDKSRNRIDMLVEHGVGYKEPRHVHDSSHSCMILKGKAIVEGKTLGPGSYIYAEANVEHGPYEYPEGMLIFAHFEGPSVAHKY